MHPSTTRRALLTGAVTAPLGALLPHPAKAAAVPAPATVFVAGATGETGARAVRALVAAGYAVRAGVRNRDKADALGLSALPGVTIVDADLTSSDLAAALGAATAVICAAGARPGPFDDAAARVDEAGTISLIKAAAASARVARFILLSSILTNGAAVGQTLNPAYVFLQLASGRVLTHKLAAEQALAASGLDWGVLRPGGLTSAPAADVGGAVLARGDTFFGTASDPGTRVSRDTVADVLVAMLAAPALPGVVELVASPDVRAVDVGRELAALV